MKQIVIIFITLITFSLNSNSSEMYWNDVSGNQLNIPGERILNPTTFKTFELSYMPFKIMLESAPHERNVNLRNSNFVISIPMPDGSIQRFNVIEYAMMEQGLSDKFPELRTFYGQGIDNPLSSVRMDITYKGFHAMIFTGTENGTVFIDPATTETTRYYTVYYKNDYPRPDKGFECGFVNGIDANKGINNPVDMQGDQLRTYRLALACTGEYAQVFGGTVPLVLAEMTTAMNRINGVYEKDVSVRMVLVANNNLLVFLNGATDPYTNNNGGAMLAQNIATCNSIIGFANYDIGHVFSTGGGGVAYLAVICATNKAGGVTGLPSPFGDPFYIDYVAHEMGHQFGGNHTFNSITSSCGGGNRAASAAYEPGSASTIMGYAGICGSDNLQSNSDAYFHVHSIIEMRNHVVNGSGNNCPVVTNTGNNNPVVTLPASGFTIPKSTPFYLTGSATDPNSDPLFYCWEQYNLGPAGTWNNPSGNAPIFRSFTNVSSGTRIFPKLSSLLNNTVVIGEILPSYARILTFRLTARDNRLGGGGVAQDVMTFNVDGTAGPFLVTFPNTNVTIGGVQTILWDVAGTTASPVSCANVKITLSTDGGNTWPTVLAGSTANDGSEPVNLPNISNSLARVKIEAVGNIFYDISNTNFTITTTTGIQNYSGTPIEFSLGQNFPNPFNPVTILRYAIPEKSSVSLKIYDATGKLVNELINNLTQTEGYYSIEFDASELPSGVYYYQVNAGKFTATKKMILVK